MEEELRQAAAAGQLDTIERLLRAGCNPNAFDELGVAALHHAAKHEALEVVALLLSRGADVNAHDEQQIGETPLGEVAATCSLALATLLIQAGANPTLPGGMQQTALGRSARRKRGDGPAVHRLLLAAAGSSARTPAKSSTRHR
jgi:ankyrin repeat protein